LTKEIREIGAAFDVSFLTSFLPPPGAFAHGSASRYDAVMGLQGDFATMPLPDLLQWLALSRKTGILILQRAEIVKEIYFRGGKIVASASNDPREYFGQFLLSHEKITEEDLMRAFARQGETGVKLGRILVQEGLLSEDEVQRFLRIKAEETIYDLFLWDEGTFKFYNDAPAQDSHVPIEMEVTSILMEGSRRADEWARIRKVFPSNDAVLKVLPENLTVQVLQDPVYNRMVQILETPWRIGDLCLMFHASDFAVSSILFDLYRMGLVEVVEAPEPPKPSEARAEESIRSLCNLGLKQFNQGQYEAAIETFKQVLIHAPENPLARTMIPKAYREIKASLVSDEFSIEHIPYLKRALADLNELDFTPQENYILSRINGTSSVQSIIRISPIQEIHALMIFKKLAREGLVGFLPPPET
jgi:tetratricopeptide (TPR) repeat protein